MPFTSEQLGYAGIAAMDFEMKQKPEDLYNIERPLFNRLDAQKKPFPGAKQYIVEKLRYQNDSNFQWFGPDGLVTYNRKRTLTEASYPWSRAHDGFALSEDELAQNFISVTDNKSAAYTTDEMKQFVNLIRENTETLRLGWKEKFDYELHLDGTQDAEAIAGLDAIIAIDPTTGTVGGIDRSVAANAYFRNHVSLNVSKANLKVVMKQIWRACTRVGGHTPNFLLAGSTFMDVYEEVADGTINRQMTVTGKGGIPVDMAVQSVNYMGVPITWDPLFETLDSDLSPAQEWESRLYMLNTNYLRLRPMRGQDMITRNPPRAYDRYTHYWGLTWRGGLVCSNPATMAVITVTGS